MDTIISGLSSQLKDAPVGRLAFRENTMKFPCTFSQLGTGEWTVRHVGSDVGTVEVTARSQQEALEKMRGELRYRLELCPYTGELYQDVQIEISGEVEA
jgi:hypothetical protein